MLKIASEMKIGHTILDISIKLNGGHLYRFFLESGGYIGFMHNSSATALLDVDGLYKIYTPEDIAAYAEEKGDKGMFWLIHIVENYNMHVYNAFFNTYRW